MRGAILGLAGLMSLSSVSFAAVLTTEDQIRQAIVGNTVSGIEDGKPYAEFFLADGNIRGVGPEGPMRASGASTGGSFASDPLRNEPKTRLPTRAPRATGNAWASRSPAPVLPGSSMASATRPAASLEIRTIFRASCCRGGNHDSRRPIRDDHRIGSFMSPGIFVGARRWMQGRTRMCAVGLILSAERRSAACSFPKTPSPGPACSRLRRKPPRRFMHGPMGAGGTPLIGKPCRTSKKPLGRRSGGTSKCGNRTRPQSRLPIPRHGPSWARMNKPPPSGSATRPTPGMRMPVIDFRRGYCRYCWMRVVRSPARPNWSMETCQLRNSSTVSV